MVCGVLGPSQDVGNVVLNGFVVVSVTTIDVDVCFAVGSQA